MGNRLRQRLEKILKGAQSLRVVVNHAAHVHQGLINQDERGQSRRSRCL